MNTEEDEFRRIEREALRRVQDEQPAKPCIGKDPRCPCQDGDACHYKDCGSTKALPVAQPEQEPSQWRDMIVVSLVREGIDKHRARELADHFAAQRPWVGLTEFQFAEIYNKWNDTNGSTAWGLNQALEAKLRKLNT